MVEIVFLILSPAQTPDAQVQILGLSSRAAQSRHLLQNLGASRTPEEAMKAICDWEAGNEAPRSKLRGILSGITPKPHPPSL